MKHLIVNMHIKQSCAKCINPLGALMNSSVDLDASSFPFVLTFKILVKVVITLKVWLIFSLSEQAVWICQLSLCLFLQPFCLKFLCLHSPLHLLPELFRLSWVWYLPRCPSHRLSYYVLGLAAHRTTAAPHQVTVGQLKPFLLLRIFYELMGFRPDDLFL